MRNTKQITVFAGCVIKNGKVLLVQRNEKECPKAHLKWELPGGKASFKETPQEAIEREFFEETGIRIKAKNLLPFVQTSYWEYSGFIQQALVFCFLCDYINGVPKLGDHHVERIEWVLIKDVQKLKVIPGTKEFIDLALK